MTSDLWKVRTLPLGLSLQPRGGEKPALVIVRGSDRVRVELADVKAVVAAIVDAAARLLAIVVGVLAAGGDKPV